MNIDLFLILLTVWPFTWNVWNCIRKVTRFLWLYPKLNRTVIHIFDGALTDCPGAFGLFNLALINRFVPHKFRNRIGDSQVHITELGFKLISGISNLALLDRGGLKHGSLLSIILHVIRTLLCGCLSWETILCFSLVRFEI